jgi:Zn-dependent peptidase ImmA (M78 family)
MLNLYYKVPLELSIEQIYKEKGITSPEDLTIENVAAKLNISVVYIPPCRAIWDEEQSAIFLDPNYSKVELREVFFHELCHPLRHYGNQESMNYDFKAYQEAQANQFKYYAAMPFSIIETLDIPKYEKDFVAMLAYIFDVPVPMALFRVEQILRRINRSKMDQEIIDAQNDYKKSYDPENWSEETKMIMDQLYGQLKRRGA